MALLISLFPNIGLLDKAFEEEGFCVVRGPDVLWGGDIHDFHPPAGVFDGAIGGPPCKAFSRLRHLVAANGLQPGQNLIPEFERCVKEAEPQWFLMENVPAAPMAVVGGYAVSRIMLNNRWFAGEQNRERAFSFGVKGNTPIDLMRFVQFAPLENFYKAAAVCASGVSKPGIPTDKNTRGKYLGWKTAAALKESLRLQGLPEDFLDEAPFTLEGKHKVIGNGVPLPLGRAIAKAVKLAIQVM